MIWVVLQSFCFLMVLALPGSPALPGAMLWKYPGAALTLCGAAIMVAALRSLASRGALTPLPQPRAGARLAEEGLFGVVRHPVYLGLLSASLGAALLVGGWWNLGAWVGLAFVLWSKSVVEERHLIENFPGYADYRRRVPRFVPAPRFEPGRGRPGALCGAGLALLVLAHAFAIDRTTTRLCAAADAGLAADARRMPVILHPAGFDGHVWNRLAEDLGKGGSWRLRRTDFDNPPEGREVHWCTAFAWALRMLGEGIAAMTGGELRNAIYRGSLWMNPLLLACAMPLAGALAGRRFGAGAGVIVAVGMAGIAPFYQAFAYPDHHGLAALCALGALLGVAAGGAGWVGKGLLPRSIAQGQGGMIFSALCGAAGLWVSAFSILPVLIAAGAGGVFAAAFGRGDRSGKEGATFHPGLWTTWGVWGGMAALGFYLLEKFPDGMGWRLEVNHPFHAFAWMGWGALVGALGGLVSGGRWVLPAFKTAGACAALLALPVCALIFRERVFTPLSPFLRAVHGEIAEFRPLMERVGSGFTTLWDALGLLPILPLVALAVCFFARISSGTRLPLAALALPGFFAFALQFYQVRWAAMSGTACAALGALLAPVLWRESGRWGTPGKLWTRAALAGFGLATVWGSWQQGPAFDMNQFAQGEKVRPTRSQTMSLVHREMARRIVETRGREREIVVLAGPSSAVMLAGFGGFRTVGTFYWENAAGLEKAMRALSATNGRAAMRFLHEMGATHVALLDWENFIEESARVLKRSGLEEFSLRAGTGSRTPVWQRVLEGGEPPEGARMINAVPDLLRNELGQRGVVLKIGDTAGNPQKP